MEAKKPKHNFCSLSGSGPIFGTAPETKRWILVEYNGPWGKQVLPYSSLSPSIKNYLQNLVDNLESVKLLFIKRSDRRDAKDIQVYLIDNSDEFRMQSFRLREYEELPFSHIEQFFDNTDRKSQTEPLYLVCTNGKRDMCCAKFGLPLYQALCKHRGTSVWQCSHFGGHRFAPTFIHFPSGGCYGRIPQDSVEDVLNSIEGGYIVESGYRGRTGIPKIAQAAEYLFNKRIGTNRNTRFINVSRIEQNYTVTLEWQGKQFKLELECIEGAPEMADCTSTKLVTQKRYQLKKLQALRGPLLKEAIAQS